ncbi:transcriptional regulator NrdR [Myxococcota bacterium]|nr:transcriptional regulator NrdR [Myxococcota bacterium]
MRCFSCGDEVTRVIDTRVSGEHEIRRRRECEECGFRFTTRERIELQMPKVIKRDLRREEFDRAKLLAGMTSACVKRPVSVDEIEGLVDRIERSLQESGEREVSSRQIGDRVMRALNRLDAVAAVRFASVYRRFENLIDFAAFIARLEATETEVGTADESALSRSPEEGPG